MDVLVSLVGAGPGDPTLLTLAAVRALGQADVILYDALVHPAALDHARPEAETIYVGKRAGHEGNSQQEIHQLLLRYTSQGKRVCRLKGGDPFLFGRGSEEAEFLQAHGVAFEVIPGVSSALGATAYAGIPPHPPASVFFRCLPDEYRHSHKLASGHDWAPLGHGHRNPRDFHGREEGSGRDGQARAHGRSPGTPAAAIVWGTWPAQRVVEGTVETLADRCELAGAGTPALLIVGHVVALREQLRWWDRSPLLGRRIVVTRPKGQREALVSQLRAQGAEVLLHPAIALEARDPPLDRKLLERAELTVFTSSPAVEYFMRWLDAHGLDLRVLGRSTVVAVGQRTAATLQRHGLRADHVPTQQRAEGALALCLEYFRVRAIPAGRVLLPQSTEALELLGKGLLAAGHEVHRLQVYATVQSPPESFEALRAALLDGSIDAMPFFSPSAVASVVSALGPEEAPTLLAPVVLAAVGPTTAAALEAHGLGCTLALQDEPSAEALVAALAGHYAGAQLADSVEL